MALEGGFRADRVAWAFASGYQAALAELFGADVPAALCATEEGGAHPKAIETTLERGGRLRGRKRIVTFGNEARQLYVVASEGQEAGRKQLVVVRVDPEDVALEPLPAFPFVPEVPHAAAELDLEVDRERVLPGDGYERYLKPFRTVEDVHVQAAITGYLLQIGRRCGFERRHLEALAAHAITLGALAGEPPDDPALHVALGGAMLHFAELTDRLAEPFAARVDPATRTAWERDRTLLAVASTARERRLARAWERLRTGEGTA